MRASPTRLSAGLFAASAAAFFLYGCPDNDAKTPTAEATAPAAPAKPAAPVATGSANAAPAAGNLPDLKAGLAKGLCANGPGNEGADSYFYGELSVDGDKVTGMEQWILFANPKWQAKGGADCVMEWALTGTTTGTGSCADCDSGVKLHATFRSGKGCPEELIIGRERPDGKRVGGEGQDWDNAYALKKKGDGSLAVYFAKSGKLLGEGHSKGSRYNYLSAHACKWF